ncbi:uncharacterized protein EI97DRAFT_433743 [Westerdykella ornata]|uniref:Uncharacterized protein n=1 Tax=Westerdykella ornata TaxID=318751 RepID=A0A6A6JHC0_WESOR|nr:uncharacterized protein EI97DRAFT_433743 [Westerdykella ornata]KAF2275802.1 hypothetical protein EI97DRAFT_433743 [Westerdykella ornata]
MNLPIELFRTVLEELERELKLPQLFALRLVSQAFNTEILRLMFRSRRIDSVFKISDWIIPWTDPLRWQRKRGKIETSQSKFPKTLRPIYFYHRMRRGYLGEPKTDPVVDIFDQLVIFELEARDLSPESRIEDVEMVHQELCEVFATASEHRACAESLFHHSVRIRTRSQPLQDHAIREASLIARLTLAVRRQDYAAVRSTLSEGAILDWKGSPWVGRDHPQLATRNRDKKLVDILLTYGTYSNPKHRNRQLLDAMTIATTERDRKMMELLVSHPGGIVASDPLLKGDHETLTERASCIAAEQSLQPPDPELFDFISGLFAPNTEYLHRLTLVRAIKQGNVVMTAHILSTKVGSALDLTAKGRTRPFDIYTALQGMSKPIRPAIMSLLLSHGADPDLLGLSWTAHTRLRYSTGNILEGRKLLLEFGARGYFETFMRLEDIDEGEGRGVLEWARQELQEAETNIRRESGRFYHP